MRVFADHEQAKRWLLRHEECERGLEVLGMKREKIVTAKGKALMPVVDWLNVRGVK